MKDAGDLVGGVTLSGAMLKEARLIIVKFLRLRCGQIADTASFCLSRRGSISEMFQTSAVK